MNGPANGAACRAPSVAQSLADDAAFFDLVKAQAATDCAWPENLQRHWFGVAIELCARFVGWSYPARQISEPIMVAGDGTVLLSERPSGDVAIYDGPQLIATVPVTDGNRFMTDARLCCLCFPRAVYCTGVDLACPPLSFVQAVARVFAYLAEHHGDELPQTTQPAGITTASGAIDFLRPLMRTVV